MDPLTQGALGATLAQSATRGWRTRVAFVIGFLAGMAADIDVLIGLFGDPLWQLEYHRHFTHALIFVPIGALLVALVVWPFFRRHAAFWRIYLYAVLGYSLSGVFDAFTSYGTHLFWPFTDARTAWNLISVIDPVFTLGLLVGVVLSALGRSPGPALLGLFFVASYLSLGWVQSQRAESILLKQAELREHEPQQVLVKPTLGNLFLWRGIYRSGDRFFVDAIWVGPGKPRIYVGDSVDKLDPAVATAELDLGEQASEQLRRFQHFSADYLIAHPGEPNVIGDLRYSMQADGLSPLWGVEAPNAPDAALRYRLFRDFTADDRERFWQMLWGRNVEPLRLANPGSDQTSN